MLQPSSQVNIGNDGSLHFSKVSKSDRGVFICQANNNIGNSISKTIQIRVNGMCRLLLTRIECYSTKLIVKHRWFELYLMLNGFWDLIAKSLKFLRLVKRYFIYQL